MRFIPWENVFPYSRDREKGPAVLSDKREGNWAKGIFIFYSSFPIFFHVGEIHVIAQKSAQVSKRKIFFFLNMI